MSDSDKVCASSLRSTLKNVIQLAKEESCSCWGIVLTKVLTKINENRVREFPAENSALNFFLLIFSSAPGQAVALEQSLKQRRDACAKDPEVLSSFAVMKNFDRNELRAEILNLTAQQMTEYQTDFAFYLLKANMESLYVSNCLTMLCMRLLAELSFWEGFRPAVASSYNQANWNGKGWRDGEKRRELVHEDSRFLLAVEPGDE